MDPIQIGKKGSTAASTDFVSARLDGPGGLHLWLDGNQKISGWEPRPNAFSLVEIADCPFHTPSCGKACLSSHHKVLTADLRYVPLKSVAVGDTLVSFDERASQNGRKSHRRFRLGTVRAVRHEVETTFTITLASGKQFITTADHEWLVRSKTRTPGKRHGGNYTWRRTDQLQEGFHEATRVLDEWEPATSFEAGWLAGLYDGEGCLSRAQAKYAGAQLVLSQKEGPVLERARRAAAAVLGSDACSHRAQSRQIWQMRLKGGRREIAKALGVLRPTRLLGKFRPEMLGTIEGHLHDTVVSVRAAGKNEITRIDVDAGTLVVEGYAHHNCYVHGLKKHRPDVHALYEHNSRTIREALHGRAGEWAVHLAAWIRENCTETGFRWHVSGDIFSKSYAAFIATVALGSPSVRHWIYTRSFPYAAPLLRIPNLALNFSADRDNYWLAVRYREIYGGAARICYLTTDGSVPTDLPEGSVVFPDYGLRERDLAPAVARGESTWYQSLTPQQRAGLCPVDFYGKDERRRCSPPGGGACSKCTEVL
jgi:hypothetical protein